MFPSACQFSRSFRRCLRVPSRRPTRCMTTPAPAPPAPPYGFQILEEGLARVLYKPNPDGKGDGAPVFYNKAQVVNRDLSILVIQQFLLSRPPTAPPARLLEALSATGLRALRYRLEIPHLGPIVANDLDPLAAAAIRRNVAFANLPTTPTPTHPISVTNQDATVHMTLAGHGDRPRYDIIDLDPYGSAAPFLDSAMSALTDDALLCVTCTDLAVLCGSNSEACFPRYGAVPLRGPFVHELALRIVLASLQAAAGRHGRSVVPLLCLSIDFYVRLFVRVVRGKNECNRGPARLGVVYACAQCKATHVQRMGAPQAAADAAAGRPVKLVHARGPVTPDGNVCENCGGTFQVGGPVWADPVFDPGFVEKLRVALGEGEGDEKRKFAAKSRVTAMLNAVSEELPDVPLFMQHSHMSKVLRCVSPPLPAVRAAVTAAGYRISASHTDPLALKTDAPTPLLWDVFRWWAKENPPKKLDPKSAGRRILDKEPVVLRSEKDVNFDLKGKRNRVLKFPKTPAYWGPLARATGSEENGGSKRKRDHEDNGQNGAGEAKGEREIVLE